MYAYLKTNTPYKLKKKKRKKSFFATLVQFLGKTSGRRCRSKEGREDNQRRIWEPLRE